MRSIVLLPRKLHSYFWDENIFNTSYVDENKIGINYRSYKAHANNKDFQNWALMYYNSKGHREAMLYAESRYVGTSNLCGPTTFREFDIFCDKAVSGFNIY